MCFPNLVRSNRLRREEVLGHQRSPHTNGCWWWWPLWFLPYKKSMPTVGIFFFFPDNYSLRESLTSIQHANKVKHISSSFSPSLTDVCNCQPVPLCLRIACVKTGSKKQKFILTSCHVSRCWCHWIRRRHNSLKNPGGIGTTFFLCYHLAKKKTGKTSWLRDTLSLLCRVQLRCVYECNDNNKKKMTHYFTQDGHYTWKIFSYAFSNF